MDIYRQTQRFYESVKGDKKIIGKSLLGRDVYAVKLGEGSPVGIAQYALHGREYITARLAFCHYKYGNVKGSVWLVPLANPDGALLSQRGLKTVPPHLREYLIKIGGKKNFSLWKANARGVDLNVNFDADHGTGEKNIFYPASENYVGTAPFSEPETQALKRFTEEICPDYTISFHTKGEEIYWHYYQAPYACERDRRLASVIAGVTGYKLAYAKGSAGGYKDWCILRRKIPSFTVEVGKDSLKHPIRVDWLGDIKRKNKRVLEALSREI